MSKFSINFELKDDDLFTLKVTGELTGEELMITLAKLCYDIIDKTFENQLFKMVAREHVARLIMSDKLKYEEE